MSTDASTESTQAEAASESETPAVESQQPAFDLETASSSDLLAMLRGEAEAAEAAEGAEVVTEPAVEEGEEQSEQPEGEQSPALAAKAPADRIRIKHLPDEDRGLLAAATEMVRENPGMSLAKALARVGLIATQDAKPDPEKVEETAPGKSAIETARETLDTLEKQYDEAVENLDTEAQKKLQREMNKANRDLTRAELSAESQQQTVDQQYKAQEEQCFKSVRSQYPDLDTPGTPMNLEANKWIKEQEVKNPGFFQDPEWLQIVADRAHRKTNPGKALPQAVQPPQKAKAPVAPARPGVPAVMAPASGRAASPTQEAALSAAMQSDDPKVLKAALLKFG